MPSRQNRSNKKLGVEEFESRALLTSFIFEPHEIDITSGGFIQGRAAFATDLDQDGDLDVISVSQLQNLVAWHENTDGQGAFGARQLITDQADRPNFIVGADVDNDGDPDLLFASSRGNSISWIENLGSSNFSGTNPISTNVISPLSLTAADVDGDGDVDVLSASSGDDTIGWYENTDGNGTFGLLKVITDQADGARSVATADLDGDGDLDILAASGMDDTIAWHENQGQGNFSQRNVISTPDPVNSRASFVTSADLDGDGDLDVLATSYRDNVVSWYENTDGRATFGPIQVIMRDVFRAFPRIDSAYAADLDSDGDLDVVSSSEFDHEVYWTENIDGRGTFGDRLQTTPSTELSGAISVADFDNDGDPDILASSDHEGIISWHENRVIGDSNDDGVFNPSDLVLIFQAGEYLDGIDNNSTFDEGDWNLDGDFNSSDLVLAFQAGTYSVAATKIRTDVLAAVDRFFCRDDDRLAFAS